MDLHRMQASLFTYFYCGFHISSDIDIAELHTTIAAQESWSNLRITARQCAESGRWQNLVPGYNISGEDTLIFHLPELATYFVEGGREISIFYCAGTDPRLIRLYLLGSVLGAAMHQSGLFPLHASAVSADKGVVAISAPSGFGKSTTAAALWRRGFSVVTDDILPIRQGTDGHIMAQPGLAGLKLLPETFTKLGVEGSAPPAISDVSGKYVISTPFGTSELNRHTGYAARGPCQALPNRKQEVAPPKSSRQPTR